MKEKILNLRSKGLTYNEICQELNCSKSIVSYHCNPNVKAKAIKDAKEYKSNKKDGKPIKSDSDIKCNCKNCGIFFLKKRLWSKTERLFCSRECELVFKKQSFLDSWQNGDHCGYIENTLDISTFVRSYIKNKFNHQCSACGWKQKNPYSGLCYLEIHHIDGNAKNCKEENLDLLCPNCHSLTPNYRFLNKESKRKPRK